MIKRTPSTQQCPICRALQPMEATRCANCGAALLGIPVSATPTQRRLKRIELPAPANINWDDGETDLQEVALPSLPLGGLLVLLVTLIVIAGAVFVILHRDDGQPISVAPTDASQTALALLLTDDSSTRTITGTRAALRATLPPTNTRPPSLTPTQTLLVAPPTLAMPTVTPAPPTPTITPTRGPCMQKAKAGDTLSALAARCGQYGQAVIQLILDTNSMQSPAQLQVGQVVEIPWPTPTDAPANNANGSKPGSTANAAVANQEPTLPAGVGWHVVKKGENAIIIAYKYNATIKILHDLNPELSQSFSQCDYGLPAGGKDCTVTLTEGQRIRVPAPTPTPSLSPTLTGSETATPSATATFNAPSISGPGDNMLFESAEFPVLRWSASDKLAPGQVYLITVKDLAINQTYTVSTKDLSFQVPFDWQPNDGKRHEFAWSVSVAQEGTSGTPAPTGFTTETRTFTWQGP